MPPLTLDEQGSTTRDVFWADLGSTQLVFPNHPEEKTCGQHVIPMTINYSFQH